MHLLGSALGMVIRAVTWRTVLPNSVVPNTSSTVLVATLLNDNYDMSRARDHSYYDHYNKYEQVTRNAFHSDPKAKLKHYSYTHQISTAQQLEAEKLIDMLDPVYNSDQTIESTSTADTVCPFNIAPLSLFDSKLVKDWNGKMTITTDSASVTYSTPDGAKLVITMDDNNAIIKTLHNLSLTIITPGAEVKSVAEGQHFDYTVEPGHALFLSVQPDKSDHFLAQDIMFFYQNGILKASESMLIPFNPSYSPVDIVRIGLSPTWTERNEYRPFIPAPNPTPTFSPSFRVEVDELARCALDIINMRPAPPVSTLNRVAKLRPFYEHDPFGPETILDYINTLINIDDISTHLFDCMTSTPALKYVLLKAATILQDAGKQDNYVDLWWGDFINSNVAYYGGSIRHDDIMLMSAFMMQILDIYKEPKYDEIMTYCRAPRIMAALMLYINDHFVESMVWQVSEEINKKYPLTDIMKIIIDGSKNYTYETMLPVIEKYHDEALGQLYNVIQRIRSNVEPDMMQSFSSFSIQDPASRSSSSVFPEKARWNADQMFVYITPAMLYRFCRDLSFDHGFDGSKYIWGAWLRSSRWDRLFVAQFLAITLTMDPTDQVALSMLNWLPNYLTGFVYDNLKAVGVDTPLQPAYNPWHDQPYIGQLNNLLYWINADWPINDDGHQVTAYLADAFSGYALPWHLLNKNNTAMAFGVTWSGLDPVNLQTILKSGTDTVAVQSLEWGKASIFLSATKTPKYIYHVKLMASTCTLIGKFNSGLYSGEIKVSAGDYIVVLDSPKNGDQIADLITVDLQNVEDDETLRFILNGYSHRPVDVLFHIGASSKSVMSGHFALNKNKMFSSYFAPLSFSDSKLLAELKETLTIDFSVDHLEYNDSKGSLRLSKDVNSVFLETMSEDKSVAIVTPGRKPGLLEQGRSIPFDSTLLLCFGGKADILTALDNVHFYQQGVLPASAQDLLPESSSTAGVKMDLVKIGTASQWPKWNPTVTFRPAPDNRVPFAEFIFNDVRELTKLLFHKIVDGRTDATSPENRVAKMAAFMDSDGTVLDAVKGIDSADRLSELLFCRNAVAPALFNVLTRTAISLHDFGNDKHIAQFCGGYLQGEMSRKYDKVAGVAKMIAGSLVQIFNVNTTPDYDLLRTVCREKVEILAAILYHIVQLQMLDRILVVQVDIKTRFPLPDDVKKLIDGAATRNFDSFLELVTNGHDLIVDNLMSIAERLRSNLDVGMLKNMFKESLNRCVRRCSSRVVPEKSAYCNIKNLHEIAQFGHDASFNPSDATMSIVAAFKGASENDRLELARYFTIALCLQGGKNYVQKLLSFLPPYLEAYVYDNLPANGIEGNLHKGENIWSDKNYQQDAAIALHWNDTKWLRDRMLIVYAFSADAPCGPSLPYHLLNKKGFAMSFAKPWDGLDMQTISTIAINGKDAAAVECWPTAKKVMLAIARSNHNIFAYHLEYESLTCTFIQECNGNWVVRPWVPKPNDFFIVLHDPVEGQKVTDMITQAVKGCDSVESVRFILNGFTRHPGDTIFMISQ